jgi:hypothetical protein
MVATVTSFYDLAIGAPLDLQIRQIALSIQNSYAKNVNTCVYYNRETASRVKRRVHPSEYQRYENWDRRGIVRGQMHMIY